MTEKYWDPLNKAAMLVTLFTGVPAFLTFIGLPFLAAVLLGVLSILSLSFVLIRERMLEARGKRLSALNKNDENLIQSFNELIAGKNLSRMPSLLSEALNNIREFVEADTSCKAVVSIREIKPNLDVVQVLASGDKNAKPVIFNMNQDSGFSSVWYGNPTRIFYPQTSSKKQDFYLPKFTSKYQTLAIFPIMAINKKPDHDTDDFTYWGFFVVDLEKKRKISEETKSVLLKYSHLFFLLFTSISSTLYIIAQQDAPADAKKPRR